MMENLWTKQALYESNTEHPTLWKRFAVLPAIIAAVIVSSFATTQTAHAAQSPQTIELASANLVRPNDINSGTLLFPSKREGYYVEAPRLATSVKIDISGPIARAIVTQRFENPSKSWVEGIYVFPLPDDSAVDTLKMKIGDRTIEGLIKPKAKAREIYEQAKREGKKASLLEQQRPNMFTNAVANIGPGETIVIQIEYQQTVKQDSGTFSLRFPMVVAPRYNPKPIVQTVDFKQGKSGWGAVDPVPDRDKITPPVLDPRTNAKINPVKLSVHLAAGFPLDTVISHFHKIDVKSIDETVRTLTLANGEVPADKDFELSWTAKGTAPSAALFQEEIDGQSFILAMITPPKLTSEQLAQIKKKDREIIFVIDNSGSMSGQSIKQARLSLETALKRLSPRDKFNIVRFNNTHEMVFQTAVPADKENLDIALRFVRNLQAEGGTEMLGALRAALYDRIPRGQSGKELVRQVVFITDGAIGNEQQLFKEIASNLGRSRIFTIGIGSAPNSFFMNRAALIGRGTSTHIGDISQVAKNMGILFKKLENPVLTGLRAVVSGEVMSEVTPDPLPDLYLGEPIVLSAKLAKISGNLTLEGDFAGTPWSVKLDLTKATKGNGLGKFWARRKIASLEASRSNSDESSIDTQIEKTALDHHLVSRLTSLVAVDVSKSRPDGKPLNTKNMPVNLPDGWEFDQVFGESELVPSSAPTKTRASAPTKRKRAYARSLGERVAALIMPAPTQEIAATVAANHVRTQAVILPKTATPADKNIILGILLLILAGMTWMTSKMWRGTGNSILASTKRKSNSYNLLP
ncbi:MAG: marine proteobacterial sortase target protein [Rhizobiaceae bacterium]